MTKVDMTQTSLMLMVTLGCNSACAHCCLACGPDKLQLSMSENEMLSYIEQAYEQGVRSVTFTGGEPTLVDFDLPMALACSLGMYIDIRTNAHWAKDYDETLYELRRLQLQGLTRLGLSYDGYHSKAIPIGNITNVLRAVREHHLSVCLDWKGRETREQVLECLQVSESELRYTGPPLKTGRAAKLGHEHFNYVRIEDLWSECRSNTLLTIFPRGYASLHPCCWVNPALIRKVGGNGWIKGLEEKMTNSPMVNFLSEFGVRGLVEKARKERPELLKPYYSRHCEACYDLLGPLFPEETQKLPQYIEDFRGTNASNLP